jgi:hypothetical protein
MAPHLPVDPYSRALTASSLSDRGRQPPPSSPYHEGWCARYGGGSVSEEFD